MAEVGLVGVRTAGGQLPSNSEEGERFPDLDCLQDTTEDATESQSTPRAIHSFGRPSSLSVYSVASSASTHSDNSTWSSDRRDSIVSSISTTECTSSSTTECIIPAVNNPPPVTVGPVVPVVPPSAPLTRNRRDAKQLHAARLQRSGSTGLALAKKRDHQKKNRFKRASNPAEALAATEPPHEQGLTRMAYAEQQRWITVQQKTFTKWLNTKIEVRNLEVKDLVQDLSDGVSHAPILPPTPTSWDDFY